MEADLNGDDFVDYFDLSVLTRFWQETNCHEPDWCLGADSEPDGDVDWVDYIFMANRWLCDWNCFN